jgi:hypothetical protein
MESQKILIDKAILSKKSYVDISPDFKLYYRTIVTTTMTTKSMILAKNRQIRPMEKNRRSKNTPKKVVPFDS